MRIRTFLLAGIGVFIGTGIVFGFDMEEPFNEVVFTYIVFGLFPIIWVQWQLSKQQIGWSHIIHGQNVNKQIPHLTGLFIVLFFFSLGVAWLSTFLLSFPFPEYVEWFFSEDMLPEEPIPYFLMIIYISVIGPIAEELFFRGILLKRLAKKTNMKLSIFISSALFGILHFDIIGGFIFGVIMALLYLHTDNLFIPILIHVVNNSLVTFLTVFEVPIPDFMVYETIADIQNVIIPNIIILIITTPLLIILLKKYRENDFIR